MSWTQYYITFKLYISVVSALFQKTGVLKFEAYY